MADPRVATPHVTRSYVVPAYDPEAPGEAAALSVLAQILGGGATSRFSRALEVERKIAVGTGASYAGQARGVTSFGIYGTPVEGQSLADVEAGLENFRQLVEEQGRDPGGVSINIQIMDTSNLDRLKEYRDLGIERATIGVSMDLWDRPEAVMPMIDRYAKIIPELAP